MAGIAVNNRPYDVSSGLPGIDALHTFAADRRDTGDHYQVPVRPGSIPEPGPYADSRTSPTATDKDKERANGWANATRRFTEVTTNGIYEPNPGAGSAPSRDPREFTTGFERPLTQLNGPPLYSSTHENLRPMEGFDGGHASFAFNPVADVDSYGYGRGYYRSTRPTNYIQPAPMVQQITPVPAEASQNPLLTGSSMQRYW